MRLFRRLTPRAALVALVTVAVGLAGCAPDVADDAIHVAEVHGTVDAVLDRYVERVIAHAEERDARLLLLAIDTPGGEISTMKRVVGRIEQSGVPVVTWVGPPGAQAVSAGTFILMAGHVAAMAPGTSTGAASPVLATGQDLPETIGRKVEEDTVAFARGVAEQHGRNADWAESAVREAVAASPQQAVDLGVVDLVAPSREALLAALEGREVTFLDGRSVTLRLEGVAVEENPLTAFERVLKVVANPLVVSLLVLVGLGGIAVEFFSPGLILPGTAGLVSLVLGFMGAGALLPTEAALLLFVVAAVFLVAEFFIPGGILGGVGLVALLLAMALWTGQAAMTVSLAQVALLTVGVLVLALGAFVLTVRYFDARGIAGPPQAG